MSELLEHFGVDWKLLIAQAINFFVLLAVLWKFAYGPLLAMFRERRARIAQGLADAKAARERLEAADRTGEEKIASARAAALGIVSSAEALARQKKDEVAEEAARQAEAIRADARRRAGEERFKAEEAFWRDAEGLLRSGVEKVLATLPSEARDRELMRRAVAALKSAARTS